MTDDKREAERIRRRNIHVATYRGSTATVQAGMASVHRDAARTHRFPINESILQMAEAEYERQHGTSQTIDRLRERGGLGLNETLMLLACALERYAPSNALTPESLTKGSEK